MNKKDQQVTHWDWDYMTNEQIAALCEQHQHLPEAQLDEQWSSTPEDKESKRS